MDLAVALFGFASSPGNQAALKTALVTPRSESSRAAPSTTLHRAPCISGREVGRNGRKNYRKLQAASKQEEGVLSLSSIAFIAKVEPPSASIPSDHPTVVVRNYRRALVVSETEHIDRTG